MKKLLLAMLLGLLISGCAGNRMWMKDGATQEIWKQTTQDKFEQDSRECLYEAEKHGFVPITGNSGVLFADGISAGLQEVMRKRGLFKQCMECRGYSLQSR